MRRTFTAHDAARHVSLDGILQLLVMGSDCVRVMKIIALVEGVKGAFEHPRLVGPRGVDVPPQLKHSPRRGAWTLEA